MPIERRWLTASILRLSIGGRKMASFLPAITSTDSSVFKQEDVKKAIENGQVSVAFNACRKNLVLLVKGFTIISYLASRTFLLMMALETAG
jgi:hypothetical protein